MTKQQTMLKHLFSYYNYRPIIQYYQLIPYKIKLNNPLNTASSCLKVREGFLIKLSCSHGFSAIGECAPMKEIGTENLHQAKQCLEQYLVLLLGKKASVHTLPDPSTYPASYFALEYALLSLLAQKKDISITSLLKIFWPQNNHSQIKVNALLGSLNEQSISHARDLELRGFRCLKIKLGVHSLEEEVQQIKALFKQLLPSTKLRFDANKHWSIEQSEWLLATLKDYESQIDSIEEPLSVCRYHDYYQLQQKTTISLALDESFSRTKGFDDFPVKRLIIKPMAQGGLLASLERIKAAQHHGIETIVTSSFETGHGLWAITQLCALLDNKHHHGLATANWLSDPLIVPPEIHHGTIDL
jgi:o-succinylbenzoate synthase